MFWEGSRNEFKFTYMYMIYLHKCRYMSSFINDVQCILICDYQYPPWHSVESDKHQQQSTDSALKLEAAQMWDTFLWLFKGVFGMQFDGTFTHYLQAPRYCLAVTVVFICQNFVTYMYWMLKLGLETQYFFHFLLKEVEELS